MALLISSSLLVTACDKRAARLEGSDSLNTASTAQPSLEKTAELGKRWQSDMKNIPLGLAYADGLEKLGQTDQQLEVMKAMADQNPGDAKFQTIYGKKLVNAGRFDDAMPVLQSVVDSGQADWRTYSALGSALDQRGQYAKARETYQKALALQPNQVSVVNNMGMSYALEGNLKEAEKILRGALALPDAKTFPRIRQNLALVVGLQGRFEESRQIAIEDLPADQVDANLAYLQKMLSQPNTWQQLSSTQ
jgi:Flp pilus assembly protein TadD